MKVCRIVYTYSPHLLGGADIHTEKIHKALSKTIASSVVITINPAKEDVVEERDGVKIYRFHPFNVSTLHKIGREGVLKQGIWTLLDIYSLYSYIKIKDILKKERPDVVHLHTPIDITLSAVAAVKGLNLPLVYTLHDYFLLCRRLCLLHGFERLCTDKDVNPLCKIYREFTKRITNRKIDTVIAPSQFVLDIHKRHGFFKDSKTVVLPHGIELSGIYNDKEPEPGKRRYTNILYTGALTKPKGVGVLIRSVKQIQDKDIRLHIIGSGIYEEKLRALAESDDRIIFHGKLPNDDLLEFYKMADVSVVPSIWYDVRPNVIPEAFRAGTPVIGSDIGGIPELIKNRHNGFLFEPGDEAQLKKILEEIIKDPAVLKEMAKNAQDSVKIYDMKDYIQRLVAVYEEAILINRPRAKT